MTKSVIVTGARLLIVRPKGAFVGVMYWPDV